MAVFYVKHHLYPDNPQVFLTDIEQIVTTESDGDHLWHVVLYTSGLDSNGDTLDPVYINAYTDNIDSLDELIMEKIAEISPQIDWTKSWYDGEYAEGIDHTPPKVVWHLPSDNQTNVPIGSSVSARLVDLLPSKGIDLSSISMTIGGVTISPTINGNKYDCVISYKPFAAS
jgi:hypothetical protein